MPDLNDEELRATRKLNGVEWKVDKEIQVGDYCRSESGQIRKVTRIIPCYENGKILNDSYYIEFDGLGNIGTYKNNQAKEMFITKHSPNLIDLIEVGDYVNGRLVLDVDYKRANLCLLIKLTDTMLNVNAMWYGYEDIKTIVTHEQFNSVMYKVKE